MRPVDLAREHGLSAQAIRNYDAAGVLPATERSETGYRRYTPLHAQALRAFLALRRGHGHQQAMEILRSAGIDPAERTLIAPWAKSFSSTAAIWERPAFWTQTKRTSGTPLGRLPSACASAESRSRANRRVMIGRYVRIFAVRASAV